MIWHFFEVWFLLLGAFVIGCGLGASLYAGLGNSALATVQGKLADSIGDMIDSLKARFGLGPDWRDGFRVRVPVERPAPRRRIRERRSREPARDRDDEIFDEGDFESEEVAALSRALAAHGRERDADRDWEDEGDDERQDWDREAVYEDEADTVAADESFDEEPVEPPVADEPAAPPPPVDEVVAKRPAGLLAPRNGVPDHLQRIRGIGKGNEELLNGLGIFHFGQIAAWTPAEARWVAAQMPFGERIEWDDWIGQATILASGGDTGYVKSAEKRRARRAAGENSGGNDENPD